MALVPKYTTVARAPGPVGSGRVSGYDQALADYTKILGEGAEEAKALDQQIRTARLSVDANERAAQFSLGVQDALTRSQQLTTTENGQEVLAGVDEQEAFFRQEIDKLYEQYGTLDTKRYGRTFSADTRLAGRLTEAQTGLTNSLNGEVASGISKLRSAQVQREMQDIYDRSLASIEVAKETGNQVLFEEAHQNMVSAGIESDAKRDEELDNWDAYDSLRKMKLVAYANPEQALELAQKARAGSPSKVLETGLADIETRARQRRVELNRQQQELWETTDAESFDRLTTGQLTLDWLKEQRESGAMPESRYQHYVTAMTSQSGDGTFNYPYWEQVDTWIDMLRDGDMPAVQIELPDGTKKLMQTKEEFYGVINDAITNGWGRAFGNTEAKELRRRLGSVKEEDSIGSSSFMSDLKSELRILRSAGALSDAGGDDATKKALANGKEYTRMVKELEIYAQQHPDASRDDLESYMYAMVDKNQKTFWQRHWIIGLGRYSFAGLSLRGIGRIFADLRESGIQDTESLDVAEKQRLREQLKLVPAGFGPPIGVLGPVRQSNDEVYAEIQNQ